MAESVVKSYFPSQVVPDAEKVSAEYGLQVGKAIEYEWFDDRERGRDVVIRGPQVWQSAHQSNTCARVLCACSFLSACVARAGATLHRSACTSASLRRPPPLQCAYMFREFFCAANRADALMAWFGLIVIFAYSVYSAYLKYAINKQT